MEVAVVREKGKINWKIPQLVVKMYEGEELIVLTTGENEDVVYFAGTVMHASKHFKSIKLRTFLKRQTKADFQLFYGEIKIINKR